MEKENFEKTFEEMFELSVNARNEAIKFITDKLNEVEGKKLEWDWEVLEEKGIDVPYVSYDGGAHPEYASNLYDECYGVYLDKNGKLCLDIESSNIYEATRVETNELYGVAMVVKALTC